jgi:hypothetical protein
MKPFPIGVTLCCRRSATVSKTRLTLRNSKTTLEKFKTMGFKKKYLLLVLIPTVLIFAYWFKIQMEVNFFDSFGISSYFPFKYFNNKVIVAPKPGVLISENYNNKTIFKTWCR